MRRKSFGNQVVRYTHCVKDDSATNYFNGDVLVATHNKVKGGSRVATFQCGRLYALISMRSGNAFKIIVNYDKKFTIVYTKGEIAVRKTNKKGIKDIIETIKKNRNYLTYYSKYVGALMML